MDRAEDVVRQFVETTFANRLGNGSLGDQDPLFSSGLVDSFGVLELIAFLEERFAVEIDTVRYHPSDFDTITKIAALVTALRDGRAG